MGTNSLQPESSPFPQPRLTDLQTRLREASSIFYLITMDSDNAQQPHVEAAFLCERLLKEATELSETIGVWSVESGRQRLDCIRAQAERVVKARDELRGGFKDIGNDEFPIGLLGELLTQINQLARWLEPTETLDNELEHELADHVGNVQRMMDTAPGVHADEEAVQMARELEVKVTELRQPPADDDDDSEQPAEPTIRSAFERLKRIETELADTLDEFPLPPDQTEPAHEQ